MKRKFSSSKSYNPFYGRSSKKAKLSHYQRRSKSLLAKVVDMVHNIEHKYVTSGVTNSANASGTVTLLNGIAEGDDSSQRTGRQLVLGAITYKGSAAPQVTAGGNFAGATRLIIFYDKQTNGALPAVTDVLTTADCWSPYQINNRDRFVILCDEIQECNRLSTSFTSNSSVLFRGHKKLNMKTTYNTTTGVIGAVTTGGLFSLVISSDISGAALTASDTYNFRVMFTDM